MASETDPETPRRPRGHALPRTGVDIGRMSEVTDLDIAKARESWKARASDPYKGLIEAEPSTKPDEGNPPDIL